MAPVPSASHPAMGPVHQRPRYDEYDLTNFYLNWYFLTNFASPEQPDSAPQTTSVYAFDYYSCDRY